MGLLRAAPMRGVARSHRAVRGAGKCGQTEERRFELVEVSPVILVQLVNGIDRTVRELVDRQGPIGARLRQGSDASIEGAPWRCRV